MNKVVWTHEIWVATVRHCKEEGDQCCVCDTVIQVCAPKGITIEQIAKYIQYEAQKFAWKYEETISIENQGPMHFYKDPDEIFSEEADDFLNGLEI